jgi:hypothetical protein
MRCVSLFEDKVGSGGGTLDDDRLTQMARVKFMSSGILLGGIWAHVKLMNSGIMLGGIWNHNGSWHSSIFDIRHSTFDIHMIPHPRSSF